jgi:O-antigen/teichoic acid export membrane protein
MVRFLEPRLVIRPVIDRLALRETIGFGAWQLCNNLGDLFTQQAQRWQLGAWLSVSSVGFYNLSYQLAGIVYSVATRVGQVFFPEISRLQGLGNDGEAATLLVRVNWLLSCIQIPSFVVIFTLSHDILQLWAGAEVANASSDVLKILCLGLAVASLFAVPSYYLLGVGKPKWLAIMAGIQGIITLTSAIFLIPWIGLGGAAWALTAGTMTHVGILIVLWRNCLRTTVTFPEYFSSTFGSIICGAACALAFSGLRAHYDQTATFTGAFAAALAIGVISLGLCLLVSLLLPGGEGRHRWLKGSVAKVRDAVGARLRLVEL